MRPKLRKIKQTKIPLYWSRGGADAIHKTHIGYLYPERNIIATPRGNFSILNRLNANGKSTDPKNKMHLRRVQAAYQTKDFTYYGD